MIAEIDGTIRFGKPLLRSKERIIIEANDGTSVEYLVDKNTQISHSFRRVCSRR